jgi:hypothetical protein
VALCCGCRDLESGLTCLLQAMQDGNDDENHDKNIIRIS